MQAHRQQSIANDRAETASWPFCAGTMADGIRTFDWSVTPLGAMELWPPVLKFAVSEALESRFPGLVVWGPGLTAIYNDGCVPFFGDRPEPLGRPFQETWADIWGAVGPIYENAIAGEPSFFADLPLMVPRPGEPDLSWWTFSCSPIRDEAGRIGGVRATILETSARVRLERRQTLLLSVGDALRRLDDGATIAAEACALLGRHLGADRVGYAEIDMDGGTARVGRGWTSDERPDRPGSYPLREFGGRFIEGLRSGETVAVNDVATDTRASDGTIYARLQIRAILVVPLLRDGLWISALSVAMAVPHAWMREEIGVVTAVAERIWEAVERARAETSLRHSRLRLDTALEAARMVAWDWDPAADRVAVSGNVGEVFGLFPGETIASSGEGLGHLHPDDVERHRAIIADAGARRVGYESEFRIIRNSDGEVAWLEERAQPLVDPLTGEVALAGLVWDVTRRKHAELASEAARRDVADELSVVKSLHDWAVRVARPSEWQALLDEMLVAATEVMRADFGTIRLYEPSDDALTVITHLGCDDGYLERFRCVSGSNADSIWHRAIAERGRVVIADLALEPAYPVLRAAASELRFHAVQVTPLFDRTGAPVGALTTGFRQPHRPTAREWWLVDLYCAQIADVIGARRARDALATSEERLRQLIENIPQLVWRSRANGHATWHSPQWFAYTGLSRDHCLDRGWLDAMHPDDRGGILQAWAKAEMTGTYEAECRIWNAREGCYRWFQERAVAEPGGGGDAVEWIGTSTDVDALRRLQEHQRTLLTELQHRVRSTLLRLRTIVRRSIQAGSGADAEHYAMRLESRLDALVRAQGSVMRDPHAGVDLAELVANELTAHHAREGERASVAGPPLRLKPGAADVLALALHELAVNAVEHGALSRPRGRIRVRWRIDDAVEPRQLHFTWEETGGPSHEAELGREGFGFSVLKRSLPDALGAQTDIVLTPRGLACCLVLPLTQRIVQP